MFSKTTYLPNPTTTTTIMFPTSTPISNTTTINLDSTTDAYDHEGAMKFTIAVVLVFGVGVIGLLGIYHRRSVSEDQSDKEADEFVKRFERRRYHMAKQDRKKVMIGLISSIITKTMKAQVETARYESRPSLRPTLSEPNLLQATGLLSEWRHDAHTTLQGQGQGQGQRLLREDRKGHSSVQQTKDIQRHKSAEDRHRIHQTPPDLTSRQALLAHDVYSMLEAAQDTHHGGRRQSFHVLNAWKRGRSSSMSPSVLFTPKFNSVSEQEKANRLPQACKGGVKGDEGTANNSNRLGPTQQLRDSNSYTTNRHLSQVHHNSDSTKTETLHQSEHAEQQTRDQSEDAVPLLHESDCTGQKSVYQSGSTCQTDLHQSGQTAPALLSSSNSDESCSEKEKGLKTVSWSVPTIVIDDSHVTNNNTSDNGLDSSVSSDSLDERVRVEKDGKDSRVVFIV